MYKKQNKDGWISWNLLDLRSRRWLDSILNIKWGIEWLFLITVACDMTSGAMLLLCLLYLTEGKIYSAGYSDVATLAESIVNNTWTWPTEWSLLHTIHVSISNVGAKDEPFWPTNDGKEGAFASSHVWKDFRMLNNTVHSHKHL